MFNYVNLNQHGSASESFLILKCNSLFQKRSQLDMPICYVLFFKCHLDLSDTFPSVPCSYGKQR